MPSARSNPTKTARPARSAGRPRSTDCDRSIRAATLELLVEHGFADLTIEGIAARAGCGKATVYRRWPCKSDLVVDAFFATISPQVRFEDTGSLRADFRKQMRLVVRELAGKPGRALATLLACAQMDARLLEAFRTRWLELRRAETRKAIERGVERGELPRDLDVDFVLDALYSPLYFRLLVQHQPITRELGDQLVDLVFDALEVRKAKIRAPRARRS